MSPRSAIAAVLTIAIAGALASCTTDVPPVAETPSATATAAPTPAPTTLVVAPGARPPVFLDGDCERMLPLDVVEAAMGRAVELDRTPEPEGYHVVAGAGGLSCLWWADDVDVLRVAVFTADSVSEVDATTIDDWRTGPACDWYCSVITEDDGYMVVTTINGFDGPDVSGSLHEEALRVAQQVAPVSIAHVAADDDGWLRDRTGWPDVDCSSLAAKVGTSLGRELGGENWGLYIDPPLTAWLIADEAARMWVCRFVDPSGHYIEAWGHAGAAWGFDASSTEAMPGPWIGRVLEADMRNDGNVSEGWEMSDGINVVRLTGVPAELGLEAREVATALAAALTD